MSQRAVRTVVAVAAALLMAGCSGSGGVTVDPGGAVTTTPSSSSPGATDLTVVVDDGAGASSTWRLTCDPAGGDHPDAEGACAALERSGEKALPPAPKDRACTMIYGGPQTATVRGSWRGTAVDASFDRTNGCEIARWEALVPLLPAAGA